MKLEDYLPPLYRNVASVFAAAAAFGSSLFTSNLPLPPGPSTHSFWYKVVAISFAPLQLAQWTKEYGPVFSLHRGGDVYIVIGRHQAAVEIMERESASLADRPYFASAGETIKNGMRIHDMHSGPTLDKLRRALHASFQGDAIDTHKRALLRAAASLVRTISYEPWPIEHQKFTRRYAISLFHTLAYAYLTSYNSHVTTMDEWCVSELLERRPTLLRPPLGFWEMSGGLSGDGERANEGGDVGRGKGKKVDPESRLARMLNAKVDVNANINSSSSRKGINTLYPESADDHDHGYTCGYGYGNLGLGPSELEELHGWYVEEGRFHKGMVGSVRGGLKDNTAVPCFTTHLLSQQSTPDGLSDDELACAVGSMYAGGADPLASATSIIIMAAATHPLAQTRVQEELDRVVGSKRSPTFDDMEALPMTMAFMLESLRWRPVTVGGYPHRATKDIRWKNYIIPKGAIIIGNHWAISHDSKVFRKPDKFNPLRWLNKAGQLKGNLKSFNYGFGQRVCPGQDLANCSLFIVTALLLWAFRISEVSGKKIDTMKFTDSVNMYPGPFVAKFDERGEYNALSRLLPW